MYDASHVKDDVARLFRENDDVGADSSVWLRPLWQLFKDGKPINRVVALTVPTLDDQKLPLGLLTYTDRNRLIFWPILPPNTDIICAGQIVDVFDHITLEFPSEKTHVTAYNAIGRSIHATRGWRLQRFPNCDFALWFMMLVRSSVLSHQDMAVQRLVPMPPTDKERRTQEFVQYAQRLAFANVALPAIDKEYGYIYVGLYVATNTPAGDRHPAFGLANDPSMSSQVDGWSPGSEFQIALSCVSLDSRSICVAAACPPGMLRAGVSFGFPRN